MRGMRGQKLWINIIAVYVCEVSSNPTPCDQLRCAAIHRNNTNCPLDNCFDLFESFIASRNNLVMRNWALWGVAGNVCNLVDVLCFFFFFFFFFYKNALLHVEVSISA